MTGLVDAFRRCRIYDASPTIRAGMPVFRGHPSVEIAAARTHERDGYYLQTVAFGEHTGSHVDAPVHVLAGRPEATIDAIPVERFVAPYAILDLGGLHLGPGDLASVADVQAAAERHDAALEPGDAALLHFGWDVHADDPGGWWAANTPGLDAEACALIASWRVGLVGSDTTTCDTALRDGAIVANHGHVTYFLPNDILIVEGLRGLGAAPPRGLLVAAPLKVERGSGAPARALLIAEDGQWCSGTEHS